MLRSLRLMMCANCSTLTNSGSGRAHQTTIDRGLSIARPCRIANHGSTYRSDQCACFVFVRSGVGQAPLFTSRHTWRGEMPASLASVFTVTRIASIPSELSRFAHVVKTGKVWGFSASGVDQVLTRPEID